MDIGNIPDRASIATKVFVAPILRSPLVMAEVARMKAYFKHVLIDDPKAARWALVRMAAAVLVWSHEVEIWPTTDSLAPAWLLFRGRRTQNQVACYQWKPCPNCGEYFGVTSQKASSQTTKSPSARNCAT
jgi:hypothetical protein